MLVCILLKTMVHARHELAPIKQSLDKVKQETTAPQMTLFHQTRLHEKHKHRTPKGLRSTQHPNLGFYSLHHHFENKTTSLNFGL